MDAPNKDSMALCQVERDMSSHLDTLQVPDLDLDLDLDPALVLA